jgi:hypothetical protein
MTYDESEGKITESLTGRTIERVERHGKELRLCTTCGHEIKLQADINGDIHFKGCGVRIIIPSLTVGAVQGKF